MMPLILILVFLQLTIGAPVPFMSNFVHTNTVKDKIRSTPIVAYDCESVSGGYKTFSIRSSEDCREEVKNSTGSIIKGQLLYRKHFDYVEVVSCYIHIKVQATYCNTWPFSPTPQPEEQHFYDVGYEECEKIIKSKKYTNNNYNFKISINDTGDAYSGEVKIAGSDFGSRCIGGSYISLRGLKKEDTQALAQVTIRVRNLVAELYANEHKIVFADGTTAYFHDFAAFHPIHGYVYWKALPNNKVSCNDDQLFAFYTGDINKFEETLKDGDSRVTYTYNKDDRDFYIVRGESVTICGQPGFRTQSSNLFLIESSNGVFQHREHKYNPRNFDSYFLASMALSSFDHRVGQQINELKQELDRSLCKMKKNTNELFKDKEGILVMQRGEVIKVKKCSPVIVEFRSSIKCYNDLPVTFDNQPYFMKPMTKLLTKFGEEKICSPSLTPEFHIGNHWFQINNGQMMEKISPHIISSMPDIKFSYHYYEKKIETSILSEEQRMNNSHIEQIELARDASTGAIADFHLGAYQPQIHNKHVNNLIDNIEDRFEKWYEEKSYFGKLKDEIKLGFFIGSSLLVFIFFAFIFGKIFNFISILKINGCSFQVFKFVSNSWTEKIKRKHEFEKERKNILEMAETQMKSIALAQLSNQVLTSQVKSNPVAINIPIKENNLYPNLNK